MLSKYKKAKGLVGEIPVPVKKAPKEKKSVEPRRSNRLKNSLSIHCLFFCNVSAVFTHN
jgi:hypothetical protein